MSELTHAATPLLEAPLLQATGLSKRYRTPPVRLFERSSGVWGLGDANGGTVDFTVRRGESVAVVGESGSGKSTLLGMALGLGTPTSGEVRFDGERVFPRRRGDRLLWLRRRVGIVFQDPYSSFNPRRTVGQTVAEPLVATRAPGDHREIVTAILDRMELPPGAGDRYPHEFSGGQRQRIAIARALVHGPDLLVADEPVSALDVLVRGRLLELFAQLREELSLTLITVTHDLAVVPRLAERIAVMRRGVIVEEGSVSQIFNQPQQQYTRELIEALPRLGDATASPPV